MGGVRYLARWALGAPAITQTGEHERAALRRFVKDRKRVVEIGVFHGVNTAMFRAEMSPTGILYAVDPFFRGRFGFSAEKIIAHAEVDRRRGSRVEWIRNLGAGAATAYRTLSSEPIDFVFFDGDHSYDATKQDWESWKPLIDHDGIAAFHDSAVAPGFPPTGGTGSVRVVAEHVAGDPAFRHVATVDTLTVFQRV